MPVNVTTVINITNTINNTHSVYNPVIVNNTYINNHTVHEKVFLNPKVIHRTHFQSNCCYIIHPEKCQSVQENRLCLTTRHHECSKLCISAYVHIVSNISAEEKCLSISVPPYSVCGQYTIKSMYE